jgi:glycine/serine hydroxymethyltransferase
MATYMIDNTVTTFFSDDLRSADPEIDRLLRAESKRQNDGIELIASENIVSKATLDALGSPIVNKTVEGYPGKRYYGGAEHADAIEQLAIDRARALFGCEYANVQPHSGSQANLAVFLALLTPGDTVLSMDLSAGGHLSHGAPANITGKWFDIVHYGVDPGNGLIDMPAVERMLANARRVDLQQERRTGRPGASYCALGTASRCIGRNDPRFWTRRVCQRRTFDCRGAHWHRQAARRESAALEQRVKHEVRAITERFPIYDFG